MKGILINRRKLICIEVYLTNCFFTFVIFQVIQKHAFKDWCMEVSFIVLVNLMIEILIFKHLKISLLSVIVLISLMSYLFQFGDTFMYAIGFEDDLLMNRINYYTSVNAYKSASMTAMNCIQTIALIGMMFRSDYYYKSESKRTMKPSRYDDGFYLFLGVGAILVSLPFYLYTLFYNTINIITLGNYTELASVRLPGYITSLGKFFYVGLWVIIFYYENKKKYKKKNIFIIIFISLIVFNMMLGSRSEAMTILFAFLIFYKKCISTGRIKLKTIIISCILMFLMTNLLYSIQISRRSGFDIGNIISHFFSGTGIEIILEEIFEFGTTILSTSAVIERTREIHPIWFFIKEIFSLTPIPVASEVTEVASVRLGVSALGSSFVGELYNYFGNCCIIAVAVIAIYISCVENLLDKKISKGDYFHFFAMLMWMWQQLNCIRASYNIAIKTIVYSYILFGGLYFIYRTIYRRKTCVIKQNQKYSAYRR